MAFMNETMNVADCIWEFIACLIDYETRLSLTDKAITDQILVTEILYKLPGTFAGICYHITNEPPAKQATDYVMDSFLEYERHTKSINIAAHTR